jgi:cytochrome c553
MSATRVSAGAAVVLLMAGAAYGAEAPPGASSCTGCHAATADAGPLRPLAGLPQAGIADAMLAFRSGRRPATIMDRIAKGFSDAEIQAIAAWYAAQTP